MFASGKRAGDLTLADLDWQNSVLEIADNTAVPPTEVNGDRYLLDATGGGVHANWDGAAVNDIVEFDGSTWDVSYVSASNEGGACWIEDLDTNYIWDGTTWAAFGSTISHNNTLGLQGGATADYYHMTSAQHTAATRDATNAQNGLMPTGKLDGWDAADIHRSLTTGNPHVVTPSEIAMSRLPGSTFSNVQHMQDIFHSAGWVSGGAVTDDGDGTITVAAGTGLIRANNTATATILFFDWAAESGANVVLADNDINYIYVEYNSGSPQVVATITERTDFNKNVLLAVVSRIGTDLHINQTDQHTVGDHANSMIRRLKGVQPYGHVSGAMLSETGTRNIAVTSGKFWRGLTEFITSAVDTSGAQTFSYYYNSGAGWQKVASVSDIHQTNYNDFGVGLATLSNNKYGVHWVYLEADDDDIAVVYGIGNYTLSQAEDAQPPSALPQHLQMEGILAGKIIIKESGATFTQLESAFETKFVGSIATDHNDLATLQGGTAEEYYHMTSAENTAATRDATNAQNGLMPTSKLTGWDAAAAHVTNDGSDHSYIDQDVTVTGTPEFDQIRVGGSTQVEVVTIDGLIAIKERASGDAGTAAYGKIVVEDSAPNRMYFLDDAGGKFRLGTPIDDTIYDATSWDNNMDAATKNAIRDKVELITTDMDINTTHRGLSNNPHTVTADQLSLGTADTVTHATVIASNAPTAGGHLTRKDYVDGLLMGLDWQESVIAFADNTAVPPTEVTGDRYLLDTTGGSVHANWDGAAKNDIVEFDGTTWFVAYVAAGDEGGSCWIEDQDTNFVWNGTSWVKFGSTITHNNTSGLQGGTSSEYYHMTSAEHAEAIRDATNAQNGLMPTGKLTGWDAAYTHSGVGSGNPHSVTPTELSLVIGTNTQAFGGILDDFNTLTAPASDGQMIVATAAGVFAYESGATLRDSIGVGTGDTLALTGLSVTGTILIPLGSSGAPSIAFTGDLDCGIYRVSSNVLGLAATIGVVMTAPSFTVDSVGNAFVSIDRGANTNEATLVFRTAGADNWKIGLENTFSPNSDFIIERANAQSPADLTILQSNGNTGLKSLIPQGTLSIGDNTEGGTAGLNIQTAHETHTLNLGATSVTTTIDIPSGSLLLGASFCVNTAVTDTGGDDSWTAAFSGGDSTALGGGAPAQNTKVNTMIAPAVAASETNITFTPNGGNFGAGIIEIVAYYIDLSSLANV